MEISNRKEVEQQIKYSTFTDRSEIENESDQCELVYGRKLESPILGHYYQPPDLPTIYLPPTILDTSLLHIPVYAHLKVYDLEPVHLPEIPSILSSLHLQSSENTVRSKSSKEMSTARMSEEDIISVSHSVHGGAKPVHKK